MLEVMRYTECPIDGNSNLQLDPRYRKDSSMTVTELQVLQESHNLERLEGLSGYHKLENVPSLMVKQEILNFWTRPTFPWNLNCEWDGLMTR